MYYQSYHMLKFHQHTFVILTVIIIIIGIIFRFCFKKKQY